MSDSQQVFLRPRGGNAAIDSLSAALGQSHRANDNTLESMRGREHMALPYPGSNYDFLAVSVPIRYQQGIVPDGEEPPWGLLRLVSAAREVHGMNAGLLDAHRLRLTTEEIAEQLRKINPQAVGLNPLSLNISEAQAIAKICDDMRIPFILGGVHATIDTLSARSDFPHAAAIVKGDGESVIGDVIRSIGVGMQPSLKGVYFNGIDYSDMSVHSQRLELHNMPLVEQAQLVVQPVYSHTVTINGKEVTLEEATVFVTQGCPFECTMCSSPIMNNRTGQDGRPYTHPEVGRIVAEVSYCVNELGANAINFLDNLIFTSESQVKEFYEGIKDSGLLGRFVWQAPFRPSAVGRFSDDTMAKLRESGAWRMAIGVESGSDEVLSSVKKRMSRDNITDAVSRLNNYGIQTMGFFIMGFPGETEEQMLETKSLIMALKQSGMGEVSVFQFKPYPGNEEFSRLKASNPEVIDQLPYLRRTGDSFVYSSEQDSVWLPDSIRIAAVPGDVVRSHVVSAMEEFYDLSRS